MADQHSDTEQRIVICNTTPEGRDFTSGSLFSLCISQTVSCIRGTTKEVRLRGGGVYIDEVHAGISGRTLSIDPLCERLERRLYGQACKVHGKVTKAKGGKRDKILDEGYYMSVLEGEVQPFHELEEERDIARAEVEAWKDRVSEKESEITHLLKEMTGSTVRCEVELEKMSDETKVSCSKQEWNSGRGGKKEGEVNVETVFDKFRASTLVC